MLSDTDGVVSLTVEVNISKVWIFKSIFYVLVYFQAHEIVDETASNDENASTTATVSITILDVNDEAPKFNKKEYYVNITENTPPGSPLPNLDMRVTDVDIVRTIYTTNSYK